jgi:hypothetical protein
VDSEWRSRLIEAVTASGKSKRAISLEIGRSHGYVHSILVDGKEPSFSALVAAAAACNVSISWLLSEVEMSADSEALLRLYSSLSLDQKKDFIRVAQAAANLAGRQTGR